MKKWMILGLVFVIGIAGKMGAEEKKLSEAKSASGGEKGLVAYWSFDEGKGFKVKDLSGKGNDGNIEGEVEWVKGVKGTALEFNGEAGYVDCGNNSSLDMTTNDFTVEVWVKSNGYVISSIISKGSWFDQGSAGYDISFAYNPKNIYFNIYNGSTYYPLMTSLGEVFPWSHIVGVRRGGRVEVWVNGVKESSVDYPTSSISNSENLYIGQKMGGGYFNGLIDEVKIYNRALTADEIKASYKAVADTLER
ncbi:hypothetical protein AUJ66_05670 [Candidatus Desantisbacteria bacterium CG1_02_38_46]|uniref:LamG-like jellyroll fold domain-containing protein n=2 Tax=unclassified Candidatus Desantisiibacteriota TaxID=3106372 RepID=A0A1J4SB87_9BACT|nr:MAG: hypothetical protein AUJ66_05670 [Candidatus Desantisbacteria bacterium CG1_02_38_46]PIU52109.1 MAG: hypothetical protein COS91_00935 [Candidatus Desantisbacteria bacterium CG07_land_8_20_14_0_80_39_15]